MAKYFKKGESIEAKKIALNTRKKVAQGTINIPIYGMCFKYSCNINVKTEIINALDDKTQLYIITSHTSIGDILKAHSVDIFARSVINFNKESNYTSTHGIQTGTIKKYGCAQIQIPFKDILQKKKLLE